jgi:hypothetical protein
MKEMKSPKFGAKWNGGPRGILSMLPELKMGPESTPHVHLLADIALRKYRHLLDIFRFVFTIDLAIMVSQAI